jgi:hypothetical protein
LSSILSVGLSSITILFASFPENLEENRQGMASMKRMALFQSREPHPLMRSGATSFKYIEWILDNCSLPNVSPHDVVSREAMELLAERLITPLQINHYLRQALEKGYEAGSKPIDTEMIEIVLSLLTSTPSDRNWLATAMVSRLFVSI